MSTVEENDRISAYELKSGRNCRTGDTFGQRMSAAFADGLRNCGDMLEDLAVALAYSWMWWLLIAVIIVSAICVMRKRGGMKWRLRKKKDDKQNEI